jgi:endogenous inhibitor of DNA gyrase (YacG/DUF329 family)
MALSYTGAVVSCAICRRSVKARTENGAFPFCSARCKQVDLGQWLNEAYRVPGSGSATPDASDPSPSDEDDA